MDGAARPAPIGINIPLAYQDIFRPRRYKAMRGGRGAARSWTAASALIAASRSRRERILCTREYQKTIRESVHHLLVERLDAMGVIKEFDVTQYELRHRGTGSDFIFMGLRHDPQGIKSLEGITKVWIEEARSVSKESLIILDPTIRAPGSEIWATWNPEDPGDPIEGFFDSAPPNDKFVLTTTWRDNPWFPEELRRQRENALATAKKTRDFDAYNWIWEGQYRKISEAAVFRRRWVIEDFETPSNAEFKHGADWGFANDPTALIRCYITNEPDGKHLWIDREAFGYGVEIDETPALFDQIETARKWPIKADNSRPETISYIKRAGFNIEAATKWSGSVEDGIAYLKGFVCIHIHSRCRHMAEEAKLYSYKTDKVTGEVLPVLIDANNHGWDACIMEGQRVLTKRGQIPIERVLIGDLVWTRVGWRAVNGARCVGDRPIWRINSLYATPDHKIFTTSRGWQRLDALTKNDELLIAWSSKSFFVELSTVAKKQVRTFKALAATIFTATFGSTTAAPSLVDGMSTTNLRTITPQLTLTGWNASRGLSIYRNTRRHGCARTPRGFDCISTLFARLRPRGTPLTRVANCTSGLGANLGRIFFLFKNGASSAAENSSTFHGGMALDSVPMHARRLGDGVQALTMKSGFARNALRLFVSIGTGKPASVRKAVECVGDTGLTARVYDLSVEGQEEFFSEGILVHNCRYALDGYITGRGFKVTSRLLELSRR